MSDENIAPGVVTGGEMDAMGETIGVGGSVEAVGP